VSRARPPALRLYLWAVGLLLLVQGGVSLLVRAAGLDAHATSRLLSDPAHATIHVVWGVVVLGVLVLRAAETAEILVASVFGVFYLGLLALGLAVHHPFGLMIDAKENVFHAVIAVAAVVVAVRAGVSRRRTPADVVEVR
jgi:hypothetical protein